MKRLKMNLKLSTSKLRGLNESILLTLSSDGICINSEIVLYTLIMEVLWLMYLTGICYFYAALLLSEVYLLKISQNFLSSGGIVCQKVGVVPIEKKSY